ncbi:protein FAR1-RELATED SEQUENCE 5-like [Helianthus annuus]|uniref:protein FAR1-RELATED SEQUENCE 5-like n=1 Tax=Helianthus annuus TaxID=4232 RepID=UPI000B8F9785|nr:protein FAR1-RELATED SEQUENCE 5-like [Helianthus annuus]
MNSDYSSSVSVDRGKRPMYEDDTSQTKSHDVASSSSAGHSSSNSVILHSDGVQFAGVDHRGRVSSKIYITPGGTSYWIPDVPVELKPVLGRYYDTWDDVVNMYDTYADASGFSTRIGATKRVQGIVTQKYILCNRAGKPKLQDFDSSTVIAVSNCRRSRFKVTNCKARIKLSVDPITSKFCLYGFVEAHNHSLVDTDNMEFTKKRRKLDFFDQQFIHKLSLNKIGATVAHRLQCSLKGGHQNVRGTKTDYKNAARDIRLFIGERDAQMIVDTMNARKSNFPNFFFEFTVVGNELRSLFWADDVSKCNYEAFGDVLGFDATYHTNLYKMIFVPFTGVDHHKKCVTFGAGLIYDETIESYIWLLKMFLKAHKKQPLLTLTDQDASMKQAVAAVFDKSIHRLCMWHIVKKIPAKISGDSSSNADLRKSIHKLVWNLFITPAEFEERWQILMNGLELSDNNWLNEMFSIRDQWVPCYFREVPMCCLMKTTSRCESSNALFKVHSGGTNTLVQFMMCFDTAIDGQRQKQRQAEFDSNTTTPFMPNKIPIEMHAFDIYTRTIFLEVQKEIYKGLTHCFIIRCEELDGIKFYTIAHTNKSCKIVNEYKVELDVRDNTVSCTCMCFTRNGYLCRHVFCVFRFNQIDKIPDKYQSSRWDRDVLPNRVHAISNRYAADNDPESVIRNEIFDLIGQCTIRLRRKPDKLSALSTQIREIRDIIYEEFPSEPDCNNKSAVISDIIGQPENVEVTIHPPQGIRNKGCGTNKRLIGPGEKAVENHKKNPRLCHRCNKYVYDHDKRNCAKVQAAKEAAAAAAKEAAAVSGSGR